jgi:hypothetical protein
MLWYNNPEGVGAVHRSRVDEQVTDVTVRSRRLRSESK